jgi:aminodeoxychorismate lyase
MMVFLNGRWVPEAQAVVSVFDRSFQYGDGLFETVRIANGKPFRWNDHLQRFTRGAALLGIRLDWNEPQLTEALSELVRINRVAEAVLRLALSRGVGSRGYSPQGAVNPTLVMSLHPAAVQGDTPCQWRLHTPCWRLHSKDPLLRQKTCTRLLHVLARRDAEANGADEALLLNECGEVCESASGNLFWFERNQLFTPPVDAGLLPGVTRSLVIGLARQTPFEVVERLAPAEALAQADGVFLTLSSLGLVEVISLDARPLPQSAHTRTLHAAYRKQLQMETLGTP